MQIAKSKKKGEVYLGRTVLSCIVSGNARAVPLEIEQLQQPSNLTDADSCGTAWEHADENLRPQLLGLIHLLIIQSAMTWRVRFIRPCTSLPLFYTLRRKAVKRIRRQDDNSV